MVLLRANRADEANETRKQVKMIPPGESVPSAITLDRLRELGI